MFSIDSLSYIAYSGVLLMSLAVGGGNLSRLFGTRQRVVVAEVKCDITENPIRFDIDMRLLRANTKYTFEVSVKGYVFLIHCLSGLRLRSNTDRAP